MNRRAEIPGPEPQPRSHEEIEESFFRDGFHSLADLERTHPLGPEAKSEDEQQEDREKARGILEQLRGHRLARPLFLIVSLLAGGGIGAGVYKGSAEREPVEQAELADPGVQQELKRLVLSELRESGHTMTEVEGRLGRESWRQEEKLEYQDIPTLEGKFEYLHKENKDIIDAYRSPQGRLENFGTLFVMMSNEFRHSRLPFAFVDQSLGDAVEVFPTLKPQQALELYQSYESTLMKVGGLKSVRSLAQNLSEILPVGHPILKEIEAKQWLSPQAQNWFDSSKDNFMLFNQQSGRVEVYHQVADKAFLLEAFPGNGGPPNGAAWQRGMPAHVAVRTPDGEYTFDRVFEKKSASWQFSWVTDTAPLRWTKDKKDVEYQDTDGKWRRLTGDEGEFMVNGAPQKPFLEKGDSTLYAWSSQWNEETKKWKRPVPFTVEQALGKDGELRPTWDLNDFGPKSIQIKDEKGKSMSIFFHSSPSDENPEVFLDFSHGCIHMKPPDLDATADYLATGSRIRISAFETPVAQTEKPGSDSQG